jgi:hypothetical protein
VNHVIVLFIIKSLFSKRIVRPATCHCCSSAQAGRQADRQDLFEKAPSSSLVFVEEATEEEKESGKAVFCVVDRRFVHNSLRFFSFVLSTKKLAAAAEARPSTAATQIPFFHSEAARGLESPFLLIIAATL